MKLGFAKTDITPRLGVELSGFGPFILRRSIGVRDRLWARAMAVEQGGQRLVLVSCDLVGVQDRITRRVRDQVREKTGLPPDCVMLACTHTHSGPNTGGYIGWGAPDEPYLEIVPQRIAQACYAALANLQDAELSRATVPCEGIGLNREYDQDAPPLADVLREDWRPAKPERTDTVCQVLKATAGGKLLGFVSYFGCHPVVCCSETRYIHGDYCGVATNLIEREHPGSVGLFLQGANGDVNSCVVHKPEMESLLALDVIAARFARAVRQGLAAAAPVPVASVAAVSRPRSFSRKPFGLDRLKGLLAEQEAVLHAPDASDSAQPVRMAAVFAAALRRLIAAMERGETMAPPFELQGFRIGPLLLVASPFETFQAIKNDVREKLNDPSVLVMSVTNDTRGYAPDRTVASRGGYAADMVPMITGDLPYAAIHGELVEGLVAMANELRGYQA
jgi:hypothetical protein